MKESKISLLLLVSLSMLLLAFVVLFIWGFTYYKQSINASKTPTIIVKDSSGIAGNIRDSLQKIYTATINKLNAELDSTRINADSFQANMDAKLAEFYALKNEIAVILQNSNSTSNLNLARQKITELQNRLEEWRAKYSDVAEENKKLNILLQQLSDNMNSTEKQTRNVIADNKVLTDKINAAPSLLVSNFQLKAIMQLDDREEETNESLQTDELRVSFDIKSNTVSLSGAEMYVVILQPDGKVMKQSAWESGLFETKEGRKIYSYKMRFDYAKGETKRLSFPIALERYQKGSYTMQLFHNGVMIARTSKSLS